jgi:hypothetical protein
MGFGARTRAVTVRFVGANVMSPYVQARFYVDEKSRTRCQLMRTDGTEHPASYLLPGEFERLAVPWCEQNGVTIVDERHFSYEALARVENEAALYELEYRP